MNYALASSVALTGVISGLCFIGGQKVMPSKITTITSTNVWILRQLMETSCPSMHHHRTSSNVANAQCCLRRRCYAPISPRFSRHRRPCCVSCGQRDAANSCHYRKTRRTGFPAMMACRSGPTRTVQTPHNSSGYAPCIQRPDMRCNVSALSTARYAREVR